MATVHSRKEATAVAHLPTLESVELGAEFRRSLVCQEMPGVSAESREAISAIWLSDEIVRRSGGFDEYFYLSHGAGVEIALLFFKWLRPCMLRESLTYWGKESIEHWWKSVSDFPDELFPVFGPPPQDRGFVATYLATPHMVAAARILNLPVELEWVHQRIYRVKMPVRVTYEKLLREWANLEVQRPLSPAARLQKRRVFVFNTSLPGKAKIYYRPGALEKRLAIVKGRLGLDR